MNEESGSVLLWLARLKKAAIELLAFNFVQVLQDKGTKRRISCNFLLLKLVNGVSLCIKR